jgi:1,4-dihydroxy-6-naphthoate synthase
LRWESETGLPLPLGGILASRTLDNRLIGQIQSAIAQSLELARRDPQAALPSMRRYAQEFDDKVLMQHVELYVNAWTVNLGPTGQQSLDELSRRAQRVGLLAPNAPPLEIWQAV